MVASGERVTARAAPASLSAPGPAWLAASPNAPTAFSLMSSPHFSRKSSAFSSRGGGTRTHTVRILSPKTCVLACPSVSGNWPYLCGFRRLSCCRCSVLFGSVLARLQYARACSKRSSFSRAAFRRTVIYEPSAPPRGAFCLTPQGILLCSLVGRPHYSFMATPASCGAAP